MRCFISGHVEALRHVDQCVVDRFYHARHPLWTVNVGEDVVLVESRVRSAELVLEHRQTFVANHDI